jgi:UDP-N-acetylglucosamine 2-epimerase (non-hydrolysing)
VSAPRKLGIVVGTRPNFVKAAAVLRGLTARGLAVDLVHTGQHFDEALSDSFFRRLGLPAPTVHLGIGAGSRAQQFGEIVRALGEYLPGAELDELIVVGDVTSTAAAAVAADACDVPVAHVEAGLRSFDLGMPEERNRRLVDALATRLFVSEPAGVANLRREGHADTHVHLVGNVMIDTLLRFRDEAIARAPWSALGVTRGSYAVATLHRPSNVDRREDLAGSLEILRLAAAHGPVLFSMHPRTAQRLGSYGLALPDGVRALPPQDYLDFIGLMAGARLVLTDSGGAQEETSILRVPCLTVRENTERPITVEAGTSRLIGRSTALARRHLEEIVSGTYDLGAGIPLWDGGAGARIAEVYAS